MKVIKIKHETTWELRDVSIEDPTIDNLVADNLTYEDAYKMLPICQHFFGGDIQIIRKEVDVIETRTPTYKEEHIDFFGKLQEMGNLI